MNYPYGPVSMIALEMFRWRYHRICVNTGPQSPRWVSMSCYWRERGAFISVLPRATGKTTMLSKMANRISKDGKRDNVVVITHDLDEARRFRNLSGVPAHRVMAPYSSKIAHSTDMHLLIDEMFRIPPDRLDFILNHRWKSVTMAGTY